MEQVDLSEYETAAGAAKRVYKFLCEMAEEFGQDPETEVILSRPELGEYNEWRVIWEAGPSEWAVFLLGGASMYCGEIGQIGGEPEITGFTDTDSWFAENHYSFDIVFYNE